METRATDTEVCGENLISTHGTFWFALLELSHGPKASQKAQGLFLQRIL